MKLIRQISQIPIALAWLLTASRVHIVITIKRSLSLTNQRIRTCSPIFGFIGSSFFISCDNSYLSFPLSFTKLPDDLLSKLPDDLLCFILSYLPIKEAVRSSVLATRWRYLYHQLPKLTLSPGLISRANPNRLGTAQVENIISNILLLHSSHLETFDLYTGNGWQFTPQNICKWVHCVASKNVEDLSLRRMSNTFYQREILPPSLFLCNRLRRLTLFDYIFSRFPTGFGGFKHLTHCFFRNVEFRDDSLALFISHCPLLERLDMEDCFLPQRITISAPHIEHLSIYTLAANPVEILTVNCPKLRHLGLSGNTENLRVNGLLFQELSFAVTHLRIRDATVIDMSLERRIGATNYLSVERCTEIIMGKFKFLTKLLLQDDRMVITTPNLLQGLPHLETLSIHGAISLSLTKDPIPTSLESPLVNLRMVDACLLRNYAEKEIDVLVWLLENSPALETMNVTVRPRRRRKDETYTQLLRRLMDSNSRRPSAPARLRFN